MLNRIKQFFEDSLQPVAGAGESEHTLHMAAAMLLLEVSRADFAVDEGELVVIADILQREFDFSDEETAELVELATRHSDETLSIHPFLKLINDNYSAEQKAAVVEDLWRVAYADDRLDKYEEYQVRKIADLLYVPHRDFIRAKHRAQGQSL